MYLAMKRYLGNIRGLNALELLVVIALIGVIVGFLIPTMSSARMHLKVAETKMLMSQVSIALEMYHADFKIYPDTLESLDAIGIAIETLPKDPFNPDNDYFQYYTNKYAYKGSVHAVGQLWLVSSYAPDGDDDVESKRVELNAGLLYPLGKAYDSTVADYHASIGMWKLNAANQPRYQDGDLLLFGPHQPGSLVQVELFPNIWVDL